MTWTKPGGLSSVMQHMIRRNLLSRGNAYLDCKDPEQWLVAASSDCQGWSHKVVTDHKVIPRHNPRLQPVIE